MPREIANTILVGLSHQLAEEAGAVSTKIMEVIKPLAIAGLTIYILFWGVAIATGRTQEPFSDGMKRILRIIFIILLAFTSSSYQENVIDFFMFAPSEIAGSVTDRGDDAGIASVIDDMYATGISFANGWIVDIEAVKLADAILRILIGLTIGLLTIVLCGIALATVFLAYLSLTVLLAVGPLFIMMMIFDQTKRFFDGWLSQVITFSTVFVMVAVTCVICMDILKTNLDHEHNVVAALKAFGYFLCMIVVMVQVRGIAAGIGGGISMQSLSIAKQVMGNTTAPAGTAMSILSKTAGGAKKIAGKLGGGAKNTAGESASGSATGRARLTQSPK